MDTEHQTPVMIVPGLFILFLVIIPISKDIYGYSHPAVSEKFKNCCGGNNNAKTCEEIKQWPVNDFNTGFVGSQHI